MVNERSGRSVWATSQRPHSSTLRLFFLDDAQALLAQLLCERCNKPRAMLVVFVYAASILDLQDNTDAIVFVIDSADAERMEEANLELTKLLTEEDKLAGVPVVVCVLAPSIRHPWPSVACSAPAPYAALQTSRTSCRLSPHRTSLSASIFTRSKTDRGR